MYLIIREENIAVGNYGVIYSVGDMLTFTFEDGRIFTDSKDSLQDLIKDSYPNQESANIDCIDLIKQHYNTPFKNHYVYYLIHKDELIEQCI